MHALQTTIYRKSHLCLPRLGNAITSAHVSQRRLQATTTAGRREDFYNSPVEYYQTRFLHGASFRDVESIIQKGLTGKKVPIASCLQLPEDGLIPGMTSPPEVLVLLDKNKLLAEGVSMTKSKADGSFTTQGQVQATDDQWIANTDPAAEGTLRPFFIRKIIDNRPGKNRGNALYLANDAWSDPSVKERVEVDQQELPDELVHATSADNLWAIWSRGILPNGSENVNGDPMKQGHINAVLPPSDGRKRIAVAGLQEIPDVKITIDVKKAREMGVSVLRSSHRDDHFFLQGVLPPECLVGVHANSTASIPASLQAKVVSPSESFKTLPIIDLRKDESELVPQMKYACNVPGFFQVIGHNVPEALEEKFLDIQKKFFALPRSVKKAVGTTDDSPVRGYFGRGAENLDGVLFGDAGDRVQQKKRSEQNELVKSEGKLTDNKEGFDVNGVPWSNPEGGEVARVFGLSPSFPDAELPDMRETAEALSAELFKMCGKLMRLMALALDLKPDFFEAYLTNPVATHRMLHYWPLVSDFDRQIGIGEHTDYGLLTVLKQDNVGGLQVLSALDMEWVMVPPISGAYVVNLGDMMSIWTGNYFKSTIHRVVNTTKRDRYSSPYFLEPNLDTILKKGELAPRSPEKKAEAILEEFYSAAGLLKTRT
jgi:isopenicillin N synthase-like dioxygenase/RNA:NAD 2'-phosphotransferase (TPT1/KptA family)